MRYVLEKINLNLNPCPNVVCTFIAIELLQKYIFLYETTDKHRFTPIFICVYLYGSLQRRKPSLQLLCATHARVHLWFYFQGYSLLQEV